MKIRNKSYLFLTVLTFFAIWFFVGRFGIFASNGDWFSQHSVMPEQFRQQFYATGQLFPEFAAGLGGGQNIYNFSYYGLYSPVLLPSYLLPFVKMSDYLIASAALCLVASVLLMHYWLGTHGFSMQVRLSVTGMFLLAAPMIYQFHRQIMFVNYMPFLLMALIGVDKYWKKGKSGLYLTGVFLMIMTSFYFSIGGILALALYGFGRCEREEKKNRVFGFFLPTMAAVCMAGILLIPTAYALFARGGGEKTKFRISLFFPDFLETRFAYSGYGTGLTVGILVILFCCLFCKKLQERVLSAGCFAVITIPFFSWILNGGLYVRGKSLIPFLPVLCYLAAVCLEGMKKREISVRVCLAGYAGAVVWSISSFFICGDGKFSEIYVLMAAELILLPAAFALYWKTNIFSPLVTVSFFCLTLSGVCLNVDEKDRMDTDFYQSVTDSAWGEEISGALREENGLFRMGQKGSHEEKKANINRTWDIRQWLVSSYSSAYQNGYKNFREKVFLTEQPLRNCLMQASSENPLFQKFMGVKYVAERSFPGDTGGKIQVSRQEHAAPVIYATDQVISEDSYGKMEFPYNQTTLMRYAVAKNGKKMGGQKLKASVPEVLDADIFLSESDFIHKTDDGYHIASKKKIQTKLFVEGKKPNGQKERIFFLQFDVTNHREEQDVIVELAGVRNNLSAQDHIYYNGNTTFTYAVKIRKGQNSADILFGAGEYSISNVKSFLMDASVLNEDTLYQSAFLPDWSATKGNWICGELDVTHEGYMITSIPFDQGFEIWIDGRRAETQTVNTAFLGAEISAGRHRIEIVYHAPGVFFGKIVSCMGCLCFAFIWVLERRKKAAIVVVFCRDFLTCLAYNRKKVRAVSRR